MTFSDPYALEFTDLLILNKNKIVTLNSLGLYEIRSILVGNPLNEKNNADVKTFMFVKDIKWLELLRVIKSVILLLKTSPEGLVEENTIKAIQKKYKQRKETVDIYI